MAEKRVVPTARSAAAQALQALIAGEGSLETVWPPIARKLRDQREQAFAREMLWGTSRWFFRLDFFVAQLAERRRIDTRVRAILLMGLYQLAYMRVADHAAISETVETARLRGRARASGFVNALLRRFQREREALERRADQRATTLHAYPRWFCEIVRQDWDEDADTVLAAGNQRAPMWLRVNRRRTDRDSWQQVAQRDTGVDFKISDVVASALYPVRPLPVDELPGFGAGLVSVQDAGAQLAATLLKPQDGQRVLDACAAPGGKSGHLLEIADISLTAVDNDATRLARVADNLERLGLRADLVHGDASQPADWWRGELFDRILLDVPCSGSGVVRRHPDIKLLRRESDLAALARRQHAILEASWQLLAPGGRLVYATCSIFERENAAPVAAFLREHSEAAVAPLPIDCGRVSGPGRQIPTGEAGMDGFYYSCLVHA